MWKFLFCFFLSSSYLCAQSISSKLQSFNDSHHLEKVYVSTDKPYYPLGDTIWCKAYYMDATTHRSIDLTPLLFVDFIDSENNIYQTLNLKIDDGIAIFDFPLDASMQPGDYQLRAYTQYQKNFDPAYIFQKRIKVFGRESTEKESAESKSLDIKFYPEGGDLVAGLTNKVAYELRGDTILNSDYKTLLKDQDGTLILESSMEQGALGVFSFKPEGDKTYSLHLIGNNESSEFKLPKVLDSGFTLSLNAASEAYIYLSASSFPKKLLPGSTLIGHIRGEIFLDIELSENGNQMLRLNRNEIPSGVLSFTLFSANENPVCERICFNYNQKQRVDIDIKMDKTDVSNREKVILEVETQIDEETKPAKYSVSVYNQDLFNAANDEVNITNYLLLNSDLDIDIPAINKHFTNTGIRNHYLLDLEMMTKAWRRFNWQDVIEEKNPDIKYGTQEHFQFIGIAKEKDKPVKAKVTLFAAGADLVNSEMITGDDGVFYFKGLEFIDSTKVFISATKYDEKAEAKASDRKKKNSKKKKKPETRNINIEYISLDSLTIDDRQLLTRTKVIAENNSTNWTPRDTFENNQSNEDKLVFDLVVNDTLATAPWAIDIEEIVIEESKFKTQSERREEAQELFKERGWKYSNIPQMFFLEDIPGAYESNNIFNMVTTIIPRTISKPAGRGALGIWQKKKISIDDLLISAKEQEPGAPVTPEVSWANQYLRVPVLVDYQVKPFELERLDPKKIYAMQVRFDPRTGLIVYMNLISKDMNDKEKDPKYKNTLSFDHPGYYKAREFYIQDYSTQSKLASSIPDYRTTLYWNPDLKSEEQNPVLSFYTGDRTGNHVIVVEGIFDSGIPFVKKINFVVN